VILDEFHDCHLVYSSVSSEVAGVILARIVAVRRGLLRVLGLAETKIRRDILGDFKHECLLVFAMEKWYSSALSRPSK
jgi:hypothetical protein